MDTKPLIRTLEEADAFEREQRIAERRRLIALGVRRGWIKFPQPAIEPQPTRHNEHEANPV